MYAYKHDPETGGLLLTDRQDTFSKEPRPVYAHEMQLLGFDKFWNFELQQDVPYMWAEANMYWYRGKRVAKINGGNLYKKPEFTPETDDEGNLILPEGSVLEPVDLQKMVAKNELLLSVIQRNAAKRILNYYKKLENKADCFYVAFSGGKDSVVLLNLVKNALPASSFMVLFGDTGMEFPDTYELVDKIEEKCRQEQVAFYRAKSHLEPEESWRLFGPPAKTLRWCCSVHKSTPQILKLREITNKKNCIGVAFVGVRKHESLQRSQYNVLSYGKKQKGQYSVNSILDWSSAEIWLYTFWKNLSINEAYKKGNSRVGCLCCPMSAEGTAVWFRYNNYIAKYNKYLDIIRETVSPSCLTPQYIETAAWARRTNGRDLITGGININETLENDKFVIYAKNQASSFNEWIKTLPEIDFIPSFEKIPHGIRVAYDSKFKNTHNSRILRSILHKSTYCIGCKECECNCKRNSISFNGGIRINNCIKCGECHDIEEGCLLYNSLRLPKYEIDKMTNINTLTDFTPQNEWINSFFLKGIDYLNNSSLGPMQLRIFKRFLSNGGLIHRDSLTDFYNLIKNIGENSQLAWSLILINLANNNPQFHWYIKNLPLDIVLSPEEFQSLLSGEKLGERAISSVMNAFRKICDLPLGTYIKFGAYTKKDREIFCKRTKPTPPDARVFLYGLYKFAEALDGYYEIPVNRLMDFAKESTAISPAEIFALSRDETAQYLRGLAQNYPDFVPNFMTTHGLEILYLNPEKTSQDVLELFA